MLEADCPTITLSNTMNYPARIPYSPQTFSYELQAVPEKEDLGPSPPLGVGGFLGRRAFCRPLLGSADPKDGGPSCNGNAGDRHTSMSGTPFFAAAEAPCTPHRHSSSNLFLDTLYRTLITSPPAGNRQTPMSESPFFAAAETPWQTLHITPLS